jgi:hypothetical protein
MRIMEERCYLRHWGFLIGTIGYVLAHPEEPLQRHQLLHLSVRTFSRHWHVLLVCLFFAIHL